VANNILPPNHYDSKKRKKIKMKAAVLDLGTNTFNLLIGENNRSDSLHVLHSSKFPVRLGEKGINHGEIIPEAYDRGIKAISEHYKTIQQFNPEKIKAYGTSAFRTAKNGAKFVSDVKSMTGIDIETISGDQEAEFIYYGVRQTYTHTSGKYLILDIGGGSNEFIIADNNKYYWKKSYRLGIARLIEKFHPLNPITGEQLQAIDEYLSDELSNLRDIVSKHNISTIVGASGAFETFVAMIKETEVYETQIGLFPESVKISSADYKKLYNQLIFSTIEERRYMKGLEPMRIEMIVLAIHFVKFVTSSLNIRNMYQSNFSLKEGAILKLLNQ
jgi:exopolyphosphatase / guanosine-5'-triphosphate,3'-diphosphate pyrophosphatase